MKCWTWKYVFWGFSLFVLLKIVQGKLNLPKLWMYVGNKLTENNSLLVTLLNIQPSIHPFHIDHKFAHFQSKRSTLCVCIIYWKFYWKDIFTLFLCQRCRRPRRSCQHHVTLAITCGNDTVKNIPRTYSGNHCCTLYRHR